VTRQNETGPAASSSTLNVRSRDQLYELANGFARTRAFVLRRPKAQSGARSARAPCQRSGFRASTPAPSVPVIEMVASPAKRTPDRISYWQHHQEGARYPPPRQFALGGALRLFAFDCQAEVRERIARRRATDRGCSAASCSDCVGADGPAFAQFSAATRHGGGLFFLDMLFGSDSEP